METVVKIAVSIILRSNRVLLVQRTHKEGDLNWQFPAGKLEIGENAFNAAEREVYEETGVKCKAREHLGHRMSFDKDILILYVVCEYLSGQEFLKDRRENKAIKWIKPSELPSYIPNNLFEGIKNFFNLDKNI